MMNKGSSPSSKSLLVKALKKQKEWENKDDLLDIIYWARQILSVIIGVVWGIIPLQGWLGLVLFFAVNVGLVWLYTTLYQRVDEEEFGGLWEMVKEGLMTAFALFLVLWILLYTAFHAS